MVAKAVSVLEVWHLRRLGQRDQLSIIVQRLGQDIDGSERRIGEGALSLSIRKLAATNFLVEALYITVPFNHFY